MKKLINLLIAIAIASLLYLIGRTFIYWVNPNFGTLSLLPDSIKSISFLFIGAALILAALAIPLLTYKWEKHKWVSDLMLTYTVAEDTKEDKGGQKK